MGFFENWKEFQLRAERQRLSTACQAAYYWIIAKFNEARWADKIELKDSELMRLAQIRSNRTMADVKSRLKLVGLIDFKTSKYYGTIYELKQLAPTSWSEGQATGQTAGRATGQTAGQTAGHYSNITISNIKDKRQEDTDGAGEALNAAIKAAWGDGPDWNVAYDLGALQERYGTDAVVKAINAAKSSLGGRKLTIPYVRGTLRRMKEEGENIGRNNSNERTDDRFDYRSRYDEL